MAKYPNFKSAPRPFLALILLVLTLISGYILHRLSSYSPLETANFLPPIPASTVSPVALPPSTPSSTIKLTLIGDIMLGRTVMTTSHKKNNPSYPVYYIKEPLNQSDLVIANLENPVIKDCPPHYTGYQFCSTPAMLEALSAANISLVSLANNHSSDYGPAGLQETLDHLKQRNISATGLNNLVIRSIQDHRFGFLGFNYIAQGPTASDLSLVKNSAFQVDTLVTSIHWGHEYTATASALQQKWAKQLVDQGVDVIVGHHPHWIQNQEKINDSLVFYSLGNFIFDQMWSEKTRRSLVVDLLYQDKKLIDTQYRYTFQENWAQPQFVD